MTVTVTEHGRAGPPRMSLPHPHTRPTKATSSAIAWASSPRLPHGRLAGESPPPKPPRHCPRPRWVVIVGRGWLLYGYGIGPRGTIVTVLTHGQISVEESRRKVARGNRGVVCSQIDRRRAKFALLVFSITRRPLPSSKVIARRTRWMEDRTGTDRTGTDIRRKGHQTGSMREGGGYPCRRAQGGAAHGSPARGRFSRILSGWRRGPPGYRRLSRERRRRLWSLPGQQQGVPLASVECVTTSGGNDR